MSGIDSIRYNTFKNLGGAAGSGSLPRQAIPKHRKGKKWIKENLDTLERIGKEQVRRNRKFREFYSMIEGTLVATDYIKTGLSDELYEEQEIPNYVRHYDELGKIVYHLRNKYTQVKEKFRVDFLDPISENEFDRDFTSAIHDFSQNMFKIELELIMAKMGLENDPEFESEEERAQYIEYLEEQKMLLKTPPEIQEEMKRNWKPLAAEWANGTKEKDTIKHSLDYMDGELFVDKFLTGRYFRHYKVGYDYYRPERWCPSVTFISEEMDAKFPQKLEYAGRLFEKTPSAVADEWGYKFTEAQLKKLLNPKDGKVDDSTEKVPSFEKMMESNFAEDVTVPHSDYYKREANVAIQDALQVPLATATYKNAKGEIEEAPAWIPSYHTKQTGAKGLFSNYRRDLTPRKDTITVTETYWRSWDRVGFLYYENEAGIGVKEVISDEILEGFLKDRGIKTLRSVSLDEWDRMEREEKLEPNTVCFSYAPIVYEGVKFAVSEAGIDNKDWYFGGPMEYQIRGDSNIYDVMLPIGGFIGKSMAAKIRPFHIEYNYQMNLIHSLTEKEIGMFYLFDVNFLSSEFSNSGDTKEQLLDFIDMAKTIGIAPIDGSKQNQRDKGGVQQYNTMTAQQVSYVPEIQMKIQTAEYYKGLMLEQIGITRQDLGTPDQYMSATGVQLGERNSHSQIEHIFEEMDMARLKDMEIHLAVAQYAQTNNKDISVKYTNSDGVLSLLNFSDEWFHLRKFGLMPIASSEKNRQLEEFKGFLMQNNTFSNDLLDYAKVLTSPSFTEVMQHLQEARLEQQKEIQAQRDHEQQLEDKRNQTQVEIHEDRTAREEESKDKDRENRIQVKLIESYGRAIGRDVDTYELDRMDRAADRSQKLREFTTQMGIKAEEIRRKRDMDNRKMALEEEELELKREQLEVRREENRGDTMRVLNK